MVPHRSFFKKLIADVKSDVSELMTEVQYTDLNREKKRTFLRNPKKTPFVPPELLELESNQDTDESELTEEERLKKKGPTDMTIPKDKRSAWKRLVAGAKERVDEQMSRASSRLAKSENPAVQRILDAKYDLQDKVDDMRDEFNVSNDKVISTMRRIGDTVTSESDHSYALGELLQQDPDYSPFHLIEDLEEYMIPVVVKSFFRGDVDMMRSATADTALDATTAAIRERVTKKQFWDDTVLGNTNVEIQEYAVENFVPVVRVTFICDQIHCVRNAKDEVVEGSPAELRRIFYMWTLKRDFINPDFDWKIIDFKYQPVLSLQ
jgi:import inner membrane translocase subunit TIM44